MPFTKVYWGDGYCAVSPIWPDDLTKRLRYWHRALEYDYDQRRRIVTGEYRNLYTIDSAVDEQEKLVPRLTTYPGFMHRIKQTLTELGYEYEIKDLRTPFPEPSIPEALKGLREYQWEGAYTALMSGGGIIGCPTGWG